MSVDLRHIFHGLFKRLIFVFYDALIIVFFFIRVTLFYIRGMDIHPREYF